MEVQNLQHLRLLRLPEVLEILIGVSRSLLNEMIRRREFPAPRRIGRRAVGWPAYVVARWLESRPSARPPVSG